MNKLRRSLGLFWMMLGPAVIVALFYFAFKNINTATGDIGKPIPWIIIITIFTPIAVGLTIFGWYSWNGEYDDH